MDFSIGSRIFLKKDFIEKFTKEEKDSMSFTVIALTDYAMGVKNVRTGRSYTLPLSSVADNIVVFTSERKGTALSAIGPGHTQPAPPPEDNPDVPDVSPEMFTHVAPNPKGGVKIRRVNATTQVVAGDDPFGGLYG